MTDSIKITIQGHESGIVSTCYSLDCQDVSLRHWDFVKKILQTIEKENDTSVKRG